MADDDEVVLACEGGNVASNRQVLSKSSPYFNAMFNKGFAESGQKEIQLHGIDCQAMKIILHKTEVLNEQNVFPVLQASGMLHFDEVRARCCTFVHRILNPKNALQILCYCDVLGETELQKHALKIVLWNFDEAMNVEYLSETQYSVMLQIVDSKLARVKSEMSVFNVIQKWIEGEEVSRKKHAESLLKNLLINELQNAEIDQVTEYIKRIDVPEKNIVFNVGEKRQPPVYPCVVGRIKPKTGPVCDKTRTPCLFVYRNGDVEAYMQLNKIVHHSSKAEGCQVSGLGSEMLVTGGEFALGKSNWNDEVWSYDTMTAQWSHQLTLPSPRRHHAACVVDRDNVYLIGGFGRYRYIIDTVDHISLTSKSVVEIPRLPSKVYCPAACFYKGSIYVAKRDFYQYDFKRKHWSKLPIIELGRNVEFNCAIPTEDGIYLTGNHAYELFKFQPSKLTLTVVGKFANEAQNICLVGNVIYNFSTDQFDYKSSIETYDIAEEKFNLLYEKNTDDFDFSPYYSFGCFPLVMYP